MLGKLRVWLSVNIAPVVFLVSYFLAVVLGNILYLMPGVRSYLASTPYIYRIFGFDSLFSVGYWALLLMPFVVVPLVVCVVRRFFESVVKRVVGFFPDFTPASYLVVLFICYSAVIYSFWRADVFSLFLEGGDFISSVEARFAIRERVSFFTMALLMSNLHFLSIYSVVRLVRDSGFWWWVAIGNTLLMTILLVVLNMKWPVIIFYAGLVLVLFMYSAKRPYLKALLGGVGLFLVYVLISAFVYRVSVPVSAPVSTDRASAQQSPRNDSTARSSGRGADGQVPAQNPKHPLDDRSVVSDPLAEKGRDAAALGAAIGGRVPQMMLHAVNRMAILYPYYFEISSKEGTLCGGLLAQASVGQKCRPSYYIYTKIFDDQFAGRGTAPAAVHITAFALGGWPLAVIGMVCGSLLLGLFSALPLSSNALIASLATTGGVLGYHLSQLPGEGPIIYDHGILWTVLMLVLYALLVKLSKIFIKK